jgi:hypothetical protein
MKHRYESIQHAIDERRSDARGFLIAGNLDEKNFSREWQEKVNSDQLIDTTQTNERSTLMLIEHLCLL